PAGGDRGWRHLAAAHPAPRTGHGPGREPAGAGYQPPPARRAALGARGLVPDPGGTRRRARSHPPPRDRPGRLHLPRRGDVFAGETSGPGARPPPPPPPRPAPRAGRRGGTGRARRARPGRRARLPPPPRPRRQPRPASPPWPRRTSRPCWTRRSAPNRAKPVHIRRTVVAGCARTVGTTVAG